jgi:NAD(P)-dependent dehydrogenase (short-subunit alcohol dehydrogenase family)
MAAVSAARAAVASLTRSLALDLAADGILVNAVSVGLVDTARQRARYEQSAVDVPYPAWLAAEVERRRVPLRRPGTAEEVARVVAFALSPAVSYTTGSMIAATGGLPA